MLRRVSQFIDPSKLDYIIMNHMETDHSGALAELKKQTDAKILITRRGIDILNGYLRDSGSDNWDIRVVKTATSWTWEAKPLCSWKLQCCAGLKVWNFPERRQSSLFK